MEALHECSLLGAARLVQEESTQSQEAPPQGSRPHRPLTSSHAPTPCPRQEALRLLPPYTMMAHVPPSHLYFQLLRFHDPYTGETQHLPRRVHTSFLSSVSTIPSGGPPQSYPQPRPGIPSPRALFPGQAPLPSDLR